MKNTYTTPEMEVIAFESGDIITTSVVTVEDETPIEPVEQ